MSFAIYEDYYDRIVCMNKQQFDHFIVSFEDPELLLCILINYIRIKETVSSHDTVGVKKKKKIIDYINSSSISVMIKHLINLEYQSTLYTIMSIVKKVDKMKGCLIYSLLDYAITLDDLKVGAIITEYAVTQIDLNELWIDEDKIEMVTHNVNHFTPYFSNPKILASILSKFPHLDHSSISIITSIPGINPASMYQTNLDTLSKMIVKTNGTKSGSYFSGLDQILRCGSNYIVDGRNMFFDTATKTGAAKSSSSPTDDYRWKDKHMINIDKLDSFIHHHMDKHLVIVFYHIHRHVLANIVEKYRTTSNFNVDFVFTTPGIDDDKTSLYLWLKSSQNYLFTSDQFHDHVKNFHNSQFWYSFWQYHYNSRVLN
jgi:hypothetical protein